MTRIITPSDVEEHEHEHEQRLIDEHSEAPRFSWKALLVIIATVASLASSWVMVTVKLSAMTERVEEIDHRGTSGLAGQVGILKDQLADIRMEIQGQRKDTERVAEMLDYRLSVIEQRLAIARARREPIMPQAAPKMDAPTDQK